MSLIKKIETLLKSKKYLRDNDRALMTEIWAEELKKLKAPPEAFLRLYQAGLLSSSESIRRRRQEAQEYSHSLRGKRYKERHQLSNVVKNRIREIKRSLAESSSPAYGVNLPKKFGSIF